MAKRDGDPVDEREFLLDTPGLLAAPSWIVIARVS